MVKANPILQENNEYAEELRNQIRREHDDAYNTGDPDKIREFLIKRVNRWQADSEKKYMSGIMDKWKALAIPREDFLALVRGLPCWKGLDLSKTTDLTADGTVFHLEDGRFAVTAHGYIPEDAVKKHEHGDRIPYTEYIEGGWCTKYRRRCRGLRKIKERLKQEQEEQQLDISEICFDDYKRGRTSPRAGDGRYTMVKIPQTMKVLNGPTKFFVSSCCGGKIVHVGVRC